MSVGHLGRVRRPCRRAAMTANATVSAVFRGLEGARLRQVEDLSCNMASIPVRGRQRRAAARTVRRMIILDTVRRVGPAQGRAPGPGCPPLGLPDLPRWLLVRGSARGLLSPSLEGGLLLFRLFQSSWRSSSSRRCRRVAFSACKRANCSSSCASCSRKASICFVTPSSCGGVPCARWAGAERVRKNGRI